MITLNIDVTKIDKTAIYDGKKGKYLALTLIENRDGTDQYGNDGFVTQDLGKERRLAGERGPILGNYKNLDKASKPSPSQHQQAKANAYQPDEDEDDEIPF